MRMYDATYYSLSFRVSSISQAGINMEKLLSALIVYFLNDGDIKNGRYRAVHREWQKCDIFICDVEQNVCAGYSIKTKTAIGDIKIHNFRGRQVIKTVCDTYMPISSSDKLEFGMINIRNTKGKSIALRNKYVSDIEQTMHNFMQKIESIPGFSDFMHETSLDDKIKELLISRIPLSAHKLEAGIMHVLSSISSDILDYVKRLYNGRLYYDLYDLEKDCPIAQILICTPPTIIVFVDNKSNLNLLFFDGVITYILISLYNYVILKLMEYLVSNEQSLSHFRSAFYAKRGVLDKRLITYDEALQKLKRQLINFSSLITIKPGLIYIRGSLWSKYVRVFNTSSVLVNLGEFRHNSDYEKIDYTRWLMQYYIEQVKKQKPEIDAQVYKDFFKAIPITEVIKDTNRLQTEGWYKLCSEFEIA